MKERKRLEVYLNERPVYVNRESLNSPAVNVHNEPLKLPSTRKSG